MISRSPRSDVVDDTFASNVALPTKADFNVLGSVDSMKTMFSNSVKVPAGTFQEAMNESEDVTETEPVGLVNDVQKKGETPFCHSRAGTGLSPSP